MAQGAGGMRAECRNPRKSQHFERAYKGAWKWPENGKPGECGVTVAKKTSNAMEWSTAGRIKEQCDNKLATGDHGCSAFSGAERLKGFTVRHHCPIVFPHR